MKVYTYCSFDGSKVGFQMGTFRPDASSADGYYIPEPKGINSTVRKAFENGDVEMGSLMAGQSAAMVHEITPCADIIKGLFSGVDEILTGIKNKL